MKTEKFLHTLAEQAGGMRTVRGQAILRARAHVVKMDEELRRVLLMVQSQDDHAVRRGCAADAIYSAMRRRAIITMPEGAPPPPEWTHVPVDRRQEWLLIADAALGCPEWASPVDSSPEGGST